MGNQKKTVGAVVIVIVAVVALVFSYMKFLAPRKTISPEEMLRIRQQTEAQQRLPGGASGGSPSGGGGR